MKERALQFGDGRRLSAILTLPEQRIDARPVILIPNTGIEHRVGPNRLHVEWARSFARAGFAVLRMDLSGMGDSRLPAAGAASDPVADQRAALDELCRQGLGERFIVVGLCSGGHEAHQLTLADERIVGGVYTDHYTYRTPRFWTVYWRQRLGNPIRLVRLAQRRWSELRKGGKASFQAERQTFFESPDPAELGQQYAALMARKMPLFLLFTGELQSAEYNYRDQILDACPVLRQYPRLDLHYLEGCDHTFSRQAMRNQMIELLLDWLRREFPPGPA